MNNDQINTIKQKLEDQKKHIAEQIADLKASDPFNDPDHATDNAAVDTDVREQGGHDLIQAEIETLSERLIDIQEALERIEKGTYGVCAKCGKRIPDGRLQLVPEAKYCVECEGTIKK